MIEWIKKYRLIISAIILISTNYIYREYMEVVDKKHTLVMTDIQEYTDYQSSNESQHVEEVLAQDAHKVIDEVEEKVPVYLCGAINKSGVYFVDSNTIVNEVIIMGGGMTQEADPIAINLARKIVANEKIYIPKLGEEIDKMINSYDNSSSQDLGQVKLNINRATKEELEQLPGIGEVKAEQIIDYRAVVGQFKSCEELKNISGIGDKTYEGLETLITIE